jgi:hypothetical protein
VDGEGQPGEPREVKKVSWFPGAPLEQIQLEILKAAGVQDQSFLSMYHFALLDQDDCAVVLSSEMDFDAIYKLKFRSIPP